MQRALLVTSGSWFGCFVPVVFGREECRATRSSPALEPWYVWAAEPISLPTTTESHSGSTRASSRLASYNRETPTPLLLIGCGVQTSPHGLIRVCVLFISSSQATPSPIFDNQDDAEVANAEQRFREWTSAGLTAAVRSGPGEQRIIRSFDPTAEETLFYPRLVGG